MLVHEIRLPKAKSAAAFGKFMQDEYFPAVHKGPTRIGQVTELVLLRSEPTATKHKFLWLVGWSGLTGHPKAGARVDDEEVLGKFKTFGATVKRLGAWDEVASWRAPDA